MIVKMKKAAIVCLQQEKEQVLFQLRELGAVHLESGRKADSQDRANLEKQLAVIEKALHTLDSLPASKEVSHHPPKSGAALCERVTEFTGHLNVLREKLEDFEKEVKVLEPWGDFSPKLIEDLKKNGLYVYCCIGTKDKLEADYGGATVQLLRKEKGKYYFVIISEKPLSDEKISSEPLLRKKLSISELRKEIAQVQAEMDDTQKALSKFVAYKDCLVSYRDEVVEKLELASNRDSMSAVGTLAYIQGFVPAGKADELKAAADKNGWSVMLSEPSKDDAVPTLIETPAWLKISKPILDFIGVLPGYREWDISLALLIFFTIFFAMIFNDGGYGILFFIGAVAAKFMIRKKAVQPAINLFILMSLAAIGWGLLTGNFFGIEHEYLPSFMHGNEKFADPRFRDKSVQYFGFLLAAIHLSLARIWQAILHFPGKKFLGEIGWALLIWGNFFTAIELIVYKGYFPSWGIWLYVAGVLLVMIFYVHWNDFGDICMTPLHLISSFVDVLSYIRLFALGVAGFYVAESFNSMGLLLYHSVPSAFSWAGLIGAIIIFVLGHLLNIALGALGVMVHDIRLNSLEFSNQMGLQWTGISFKPFKKIKTETKEK